VSDRFIYCLPWPPSLNEQYVNRRAKVKKGPKAGKVYMARMGSDEAKAYKHRVTVEVRRGHQVPPRLSGRLDVVMLAYPPASFGARRFDLDNYWKLVLDSLKLAGVIADDSLFDREEVFRGNPVSDGRLLVSIGRYDPERARFSLNEVGLPGPAEAMATADLLSAAPF